MLRSKSLLLDPLAWPLPPLTAECVSAIITDELGFYRHYRALSGAAPSATGARIQPLRS